MISGEIIVKNYVTKAVNTASVEDSESECCFLLEYISGEFPSIIRYPLVDFQYEIFQAQSLST